MTLTSNNRQCGECTLCCTLVPVRELNKPANTKCDHQNRKGCAIYHKLGFPVSCGAWNCGWLGGEDVPRPDRCGWVVDIMPDEVRATNNETGEIQFIPVVQVWVKPGRHPTTDPRLRRFAKQCAKEKNAAILLRYGSREGIIVFAPSLTADGKWHFIGQLTDTPSRTGNLLFDRLGITP